MSDAGTVPSPEQNRRVLVTRAAEGASALAGDLRALGLEPVLVPAIEIVAPGSFAALDEAIVGLGAFHWLLLTSVNGVQALARRRAHLGTPSAWPHGLRVAAIGTATARAAQAQGFSIALLPAQAVAESFAASLLPFARQPDGTPTRMLLPRAEEGRDVLPETLRVAGAEVTVAPAYRNGVPAGSVLLVQALFGQGGAAPGAITFTSASTVHHLLSLCEAAGVRLPPDSLRVSIGPITSQALCDRGLPPDAEAPEATVASLAQTVARVLQKARS